ncbi:MAG TPA: hypothetical protein VIC33_14055 [Vicinamibacterales bacterium]|jgi:hypothetical protein
MTSSRTIGIVVGTGLLAAWFAAANGSRPAVPPHAPPPATVDAHLRDIQRLLQQTNQLDRALSAMAAPRQPSRNPFEFGTSEKARRSQSAATAAAASAPDAPSAAAAPVLHLEGIADDGAGGLTAIIDGDGQLFLVKPGDAVTTRYRVKTVAPGTVELEDLTGGPSLRLDLQ